MSIWKDMKIHQSAEVAKDANIGPGTSVWNNAQIREGARVGAGCNIGKDVYIDTGAVIGDRVKIQNGVSVYRGVTVQDDVFLGPHMTFTNDRYPRAFNTDWQITGTLVKRGASIGANATIVCGHTIGEYAMVAAGSVVTRDVPDYGLVMGNPARLRGYACRCGHKLTENTDGVSGTYTCPQCGETISL